MVRLRDPKVCAALVLIAWLAALVSYWGIAVAGPSAATERRCSTEDLKNLGMRLEMARTASGAAALLNGDGRHESKAACVRGHAAAQVRADYLFIPSYSGLTLAFFLFVASLRFPASGEQRTARGAVCIAFGVVIALTMAAADVFENRQLEAIIASASAVPVPLDRIAERLPLLRFATTLKMGALAVSGAVLGLLWPSAPPSRLAVVHRCLGCAAAGVLALSLARGEWSTAVVGLGVLAAFWLAGLIHAVGVAVEPEALPPFPPALGQRGPS